MREILYTQGELEDIAQVGRAPPGRIIPAACCWIEQVIPLRDIRVRMEVAGMVSERIEGRHTTQRRLSVTFQALVHQERPGGPDRSCRACSSKGIPGALVVDGNIWISCGSHI